MICYFSLSFYPIDFNPLPSLGIEVYQLFIAMIFVRVSSCSSGFIRDFLVWIEVGSMMYISGEAPFIVWVESGQNAGNVSILGRPTKPFKC